MDPEIFLDEEEAPWNYCKVISSLKFGNEEETYGPFGLQNGTSFVFRTGSEITGFHGSGDDAIEFGYISKIGLYFRTEAVSAVGEPSKSSTDLTEAVSAVTLIEGEN
ncbi:hypothetical protein KSP39_PZI010767 [Platanthera zijinensis]|uniref:Jacalin-type lectin domain-containing protein n=1 Tax=Platanthera zijinensis TaxID=2320716 RepID=A0AAP0BKM6_9ASPA